eukprot:TRINITY_DN50994_c0_g1_i1.p1 TRINITY_DN50994_c0_g1~~TRINITY_DN50994_c0_g1_i1.p1  ORF type:complete len:478 (-),score=94.52 TRINITY_DN50994_c0_g1_i1:168-1601(-)
MVQGNRALSPGERPLGKKMTKQERVASERLAMGEQMSTPASSTGTSPAGTPVTPREQVSAVDLAAPRRTLDSVRGISAVADKPPRSPGTSPTRRSPRASSPKLSKMERLEHERRVMAEHSVMLRAQSPGIQRLLPDGTPDPSRPSVQPRETRHPSPMTAVATSPLEIASYGLDVQDPKHPALGVRCVGTHSHHTEWVKAIASLQGGHLLASGGWDNMVTLWSPVQGVRRQLKGHQHWVQAIAGLGGSRLASCSFDGSIKIWDATSGECVKTLLGHSGPVLDLATLPGDQLCSVSWDKTVRIWDSNTGEPLKELVGHTGRVRCVCAMPADAVACGDDAHVVRIWGVASGACEAVLQGHTAAVWSVCALPGLDGASLASGSCDNSIKVWDGRACVRTLTGHTGYVSALCMVGGSLCSGSFDQTIRVWEPHSGALQLVLSDHTDSVMVLHSSQGMLLSGSCDATVKAFGPLEQASPPTNP